MTIDIFSESPQTADSLLDISATTPADKKERVGLVLLDVASKLLEPKGLKAQVRQLHKMAEMEREQFWAEFKGCISKHASIVVA